jgi:hypothetical protein
MNGFRDIARSENQGFVPSANPRTGTNLAKTNVKQYDWVRASGISQPASPVLKTGVLSAARRWPDLVGWPSGSVRILPGTSWESYIHGLRPPQLRGRTDSRLDSPSISKLFRTSCFNVYSIWLNLLYRASFHCTHPQRHLLFRLANPLVFCARLFRKRLSKQCRVNLPQRRVRSETKHPCVQTFKQSLRCQFLFFLKQHLTGICQTNSNEPNFMKHLVPIKGAALSVLFMVIARWSRVRHNVFSINSICPSKEKKLCRKSLVFLGLFLKFLKKTANERRSFHGVVDLFRSFRRALFHMFSICPHSLLDL